MATNTLANSVALITKYSTEAFDKVYKTDSRIALLEGMSDGRVKFSIDNAKIVKVFKSNYGGLSDYERNNLETGASEGLGDRGYKEAAIEGKWETKELTQDRGAKYVIENFDNEETAGLTVGKATTEINRTIVIPEIDAYGFSKIAADVKNYSIGLPSGGKNYVSGAIAANTILSEINAGLTWLDDNEVPEENQIIFISTAAKNALRSTDELTRFMDSDKDVGHKISFKVTDYENRPLVVVPPKRFREGFTKLPNGGYKLAGDPIDFICMDRNAAIHVVKYQKQKILTGEAALANTDMDATVIFVRIYHDVIVFDNRLCGIYVHVGGFTAPAFADFSLDLNSKGVLTAIHGQPAGTVVRLYKTTQSLTKSDIGKAWTTDSAKDTLLVEGMDLTAGGTIVAVVGGEIAAVKTLSWAASTKTYNLVDKTA